MSLRAIVVIAVGAIACGGTQRIPLGAAGGDNDEGAGELARASLHLETGDDERPVGFADDEERAEYGYAYGGDAYGGDPYGGSPYGGLGYGNVPQWNYTTPNRTPHYQISVGLSGAIEGTVTWSGQVPATVKSPCGPIDNPTLHVSSDKHVRGVIVYIDKVAVGRGTPYYARPATVGGTVAKHGCMLAPAAQIVAPLPGSLSIHGDAQRTKVRVAPPSGPVKVQDLQEGGLAQAEVTPGVTKVDGEDGKLAAAWVIGLDTPYYAITDDAGRYRIDELAPGRYEITFWQPPVAAIARDGTWTYGPPIVARRTVSVGAKTSSLSVTLPGR